MLILAVDGHQSICTRDVYDQTGNFSEQPIITRLMGVIDVQTEGIEVYGTFDVTQTITGRDAEEADCRGYDSIPEVNPN